MPPFFRGGLRNMNSDEPPELEYPHGGGVPDPHHGLSQPAGANRWRAHCKELLELFERDMGMLRAAPGGAERIAAFVRTSSLPSTCSTWLLRRTQFRFADRAARTSFLGSPSPTPFLCFCSCWRAGAVQISCVAAPRPRM